jgi:hypothetical protein
MAENNKITPLPLSELPEIDDPGGFWILGSKTESNGALTSGKYLFENLAEYAKRLQLERRLSINLGLSSPYEMFIGEAMTIYRVEALNTSTVTINGNQVETDTAVSIHIPAKSLVQFSATPEGTDPVAYLFIYAKATLL